MFYRSELQQMINTEYPMKASMRFTNRFLDLTLEGWAGRIQHSFIRGAIRAPPGQRPDAV